MDPIRLFLSLPFQRDGNSRDYPKYKKETSGMLKKDRRKAGNPKVPKNKRCYVCPNRHPAGGRNSTRSLTEVFRKDLPDTVNKYGL